MFDTPGDAAAATACDRLVAACATTVKVLGHSVQGAASMGLVTAAEEEPRDPIDLLCRADLALNDAKRQGRSIARLFDARIDEGIRIRRRIETGLSQAIARGELTLAFQPIVTGDRLGVIGFEALLRWNTAEHGPISPATFIPIAEQSNLIHELGDWVLAGSLAALAD